MIQMSISAYRDLVSGAEVIEKDGYGEKVLLTDDGYMVKIFRTKRILSTALLRPYAVRFAANARKLEAVGVQSVHVDRICYCRDVRRHLVFYRPLPGRTLRQALSDSGDPGALLHQFTDFLADLHGRGVYFRSIHFGNVLVVDDSSFALIDVADLAVHPRSLGPGTRARNFKHFFRYREDVDRIKAYGLARFLDDYLQAAELSDARTETFCEKLNAVVPMFASVKE